MAADPAISERIYLELRMRLFAGRFRLNERLDVARIATDMGASATPVREALTRLAAERLIAARPAKGFFAILWSEAGLRALYEWRGLLAHVAVEANAELASSFVDAGAAVGEAGAPADHADAVRAMFTRIEQGANAELRRAAANADDRLHAARCVEPEVLDGCAKELGAIASARTKRQLRNLLQRYFTRRLQHAAALRERAMLRALPPNGQ
jgi:DNA-binding GntR family transcriptional regulator